MISEVNKAVNSILSRYDEECVKWIKRLSPYLGVYVMYYCIGFELTALSIQVYICSKFSQLGAK